MRPVRHRVHAEAHEAFHLLVEHVVEDVGPAPVLITARGRLRQLGMPLVAELVFLGGGVAVVRLELAHHEAVRIAPEVH